MNQSPPHSVEAEQGVLGSILISPLRAMPECIEKISQDHFYVTAHQTIYSVLVDLWNARKPIDLITFTQTLRDRRLLERVGGAAFVTSFSTSCQRLQTFSITSTSFARNGPCEKRKLPP